ncbi:neuronal acetylcholine receptor subunit alpha-6-like [Diadema antillarum]|uniref:neuronal acetylcholine receptor subunit alpha-6-like n=1 Tax=Diadema antillarum TaxID=105358 RepID=UPI003A8C1EA5
MTQVLPKSPLCMINNGSQGDAGTDPVYEIPQQSSVDFSSGPGLASCSLPQPPLPFNDRGGLKMGTHSFQEHAYDTSSIPFQNYENEKNTSEDARQYANHRVIQSTKGNKSSSYVMSKLAKGDTFDAVYDDAIESSPASSCVTALHETNFTESIIVSHLLENYGPRQVRPVANVSRVIDISFRLLPVDLINFDEFNQMLKLSAYVRMTWTDEKMVWDPDDYDGVDIVTVFQDDVWLPDITLYENVVKDFISIGKTFILVSSDGLMDWYFPAVMTTSCPIDITYFPYDQQVCSMTISPWTLTSKMVNFRLSTEADAEVDLFRRNGVWVLSRSAPENNLIESCCYDVAWTAVMYKMYITRESGFYTRTVVVPAFLLTVLMALVCWLHPASGEKVTLAVSNLLALILFQQLVSDRMPPSGQTASIMVNFFIVMIGLSCTEVISAILVLRVYHAGGGRRLPDWVLQVMLSRLITPLYSGGNSDNIILMEHERYKLEKSESAKGSTPPKDVPGRQDSVNNHEDPNGTAVPGETYGATTKNRRRADDPEVIARTWQEAAIICDKLFFMLIIFATIIAWVYVLVSFLVRTG